MIAPRRARAMKRPGQPAATIAMAAALVGLPSLHPAQAESFHRAEQDREITYWLLAPETHRFRISHDFTIDRVGQGSVHSFVRQGSTVTDASMTLLDSGATLRTHNVTGKQANALGYYPEPAPDDSVVVQGDLPKPIAAGESVRVRVEETYTDSENYGLRDGELVWDRTLGRPFNQVVLPAGWRLSSVSVPAIISLDREGRVALRFTNTRNDTLHVVIRARPRS
jgi:hypothetical protein